MPEKSDPWDPFVDARRDKGVINVDCEGETLPLLLRLEDVRRAAKDWKTYSSDNPLMITLHSEAHVRDIRQIPVEVDPPQQKAYRAILEPLFFQALHEPYRADIQRMLDRSVDEALATGEVEAVRNFALPVQSITLTRLLGLPESEAQTWISWGVHVFHDGTPGPEKGQRLVRHIEEQFARAQRNPGEDFFSVLNRVDFEGRKLTALEKNGIAMLAFAGGRDTVINTIAGILAYLAQNPQALTYLREDETRIHLAAEEFIRYISPLTALSRTCPHATQALGEQVAPGGRVGLCWSSANRDAAAFTDPGEVKLDRTPNPHVAFGFGVHHCLGAPTPVSSSAACSTLSANVWIASN